MTQVLTEHDQIRQWAAARSGNPAIEDRPLSAGEAPVLRILFDQMALNSGETQYGDRPGGFDLVGWDEWFEVFDGQNFGLLVEDERPGRLDAYYEFVPRDGNQRD
jgi:hypothetical protein